MRPRKIKNFDAFEQKEVLSMYIDQHMSCEQIYQARYKDIISIATFWRYIKRYTPNISKFRYARQTGVNNAPKKA